MMFESADTPHGASVLDPEGIDPVLALATGADLDELRTWLADLDAHAYGCVFIEGELAAGAALQVPDRVSVTWMRPATVPGVALQTAVDAWLTEWLWVDTSQQRSLQMFTAQHAGAIAAAYLRRFECRLEKRWPGCSQESCPILRATE